MEILHGQNSKGCDSRMICKAFRDVSLEKEFRQSVLGYSDTLPLFRRLYPNQESHTQEQLRKTLIGYSYAALQNLVSRLEIAEKDLLKDSFTIEFVFKRQNFIKNKVKTFPSFKTMVNVKAVSKDVAERMAGSGLCFRHLCIAFKRGKRDCLSNLLREKSGKSVRVSNQSRIMTPTVDYVEAFLKS